MFNSDEKDQIEQLEPPSMAGNTSAWVAAVRGVTDGKFGLMFMRKQQNFIKARILRCLLNLRVRIICFKTLTSEYLQDVRLARRFSKVTLY